MIPSTEDFLQAACRWRGSYRGVIYELSWHGRSKYSPQGTWCWYIFLSDEEFSPDDWQRLRLSKEDREFAGSWRRHFNYDNFPDLEAHGGWTFGEMTIFLGRDGKEHEQVKVGCDYAHALDHDADYPDNKNTVEIDVKRSIDLFVEMFPRRRECCAYSGIFDDPEQFYTARNGSRVHVSREKEFNENHWPAWMRLCAG